MRGAAHARSLTFAAVLFFLGSLGAVGCHGHGTTPVLTDDADFYSCADEPRATPYANGLTLTSRAGAFAVTIVDNTFIDLTGTPHAQAPAKGTNRWIVQIADAATAAPLDGLVLAVTPRMPDHPHGTTAVVVKPLGAGTYDLDPLFLFMAGLWNVKVDIQAPAGTTAAAVDSDAGGDAGDAGALAAPVSDVVTFPICISG